VEELIFLAILVVFSILEAVSKKRRQAAEGEEEADGADVGSRGEEGSRTDREEEVEPFAVESRLPSSGRDAPAPFEPTGSEEMVPRDIWEEIAALARGETPGPGGRGGKGAEVEPGRPAEPEPRRRPLPPGGREPVPSTSPVRRGQAGRDEIGRGGGGIGRRPPGRGRPQFGTDPSERRPVAEPTRRRGGDELRAVRQALLESGPAEARKAVILHEVLGKPLAYRDEGAGGSRR
jgi:hypothetical protein